MRLDQRCVELGLAPTRKKVQGLILSGSIYVNGEPVTKAGHAVDTNASIELRGKGLPYVSRGGLKLEAALDQFDLSVENTVCLDIGASTGGFTDCLLQRGARHIIAVDVGYGQLDWKLRTDPRLTVIERTNIRYASRHTFEERVSSSDKWPPQIVTIDVSFISLSFVLPKIKELISEGALVLALVKPQFEAHRKDVGKGGVIRDPAVRQKAIDKIISRSQSLGYRIDNQIDCPLAGPKGNVEYWLYLSY